MEALKKFETNALIVKAIATALTATLTTLAWFNANELNVWSEHIAIGALYYTVLAITALAFGISCRPTQKWNYRLAVLVALCARAAADVKISVAEGQIKPIFAAGVTFAMFAIAAYFSYDYVRAIRETAIENANVSRRIKERKQRAQMAKNHCMLICAAIFALMWIATSDINVWLSTDSGVTYYLLSTGLTFVASVLLSAASTELKVSRYRERANFRYACIGIATVGILRAIIDVALSIAMRLHLAAIIGPTVAALIFVMMATWATLTVHEH